MKRFNLLILSIIAGFSFYMYSCDSESENLESDEPTIINKALFSGYVQKGPFYNGSSVLISELDESLDQTGRIYITNVSVNLGCLGFGCCQC